MAPLPDEVRELLEARNFAHLATALPDGSPHSVPVWIGVEGEEALEIIDRLSMKYTREPFPMRSGIVFLVEPERARETVLPFRHEPA